MEWSDWIQDVGKTALTTAIEVKYKQPFEIEKMRLAAMGPFGAFYEEGQANQTSQTPVANVGGIPTSWLLVAAVVAAVVVLGD